MRRIISKNRDLRKVENQTELNKQHYDLFCCYLNSRHATTEMSRMTFEDFVAMIQNSPIDTYLSTYYDTDNRLQGCILSDRQKDGLSAIYSFFNPDATTRSLGYFMILDLISAAKNLKLPYLYLGYYVENSIKMAYKTRFKPYQIFHNGRWQ